MYHISNDTIAALSTHPGIAAIAIIRVSGNNAFGLVSKILYVAGKRMENFNIPIRTVLNGSIVDDGKLIDKVMVTFFKSPNSYTGEDLVEISCHGSLYIQEKILKLLLQSGARLAKPGEFTLRAFLNKKIDLVQAEAIGDLIASQSETSHAIALKQMRGRFSKKINDLRLALIDFSALLELELDFSEEDVEFANREKLTQLMLEISSEIELLLKSYAIGNVLKTGIPVAIAGKPNVGKSTLLNFLLQDDKALVSEIPGTTRDTIEDTININGFTFRFIDTAGLRHTTDVVENMGIEKTYEKIAGASIILYVFDASQTDLKDVITEIEQLKEKISTNEKKIIVVGNKIDLMMELPKGYRELSEMETIFISVKRRENLNILAEKLTSAVSFNQNITDQVLITNIRHYEALQKSFTTIQEILQGLKNNISNDLIATDVRTILHFLGEITGTITNEEILDTVFKNFCIGK